MVGGALDTVFLAGNYEAQRLSGIKNNVRLFWYVRNHFVLSCLLSDRVYFPAANYFQSKISQRITHEYAPLFSHSDKYRQIAYIAINPSKEDFHGEALEKKDTYLDLPDYAGYMDTPSRDSLVKRLNSITQPFMRHGRLVDSLSKYIKNETKDDGLLFKSIYKYVGSIEYTRKVFEPLIAAVERQEKAIIPEYIITQDRNRSIDSHSERIIRLSLMKAYSSSLEQLYSSYVSNPLLQTYDAEYLFPYTIHRLDTTLFSMFLDLFPDVRDEVFKADAKNILYLRSVERFLIFKQYYFDFVERLSNRLPELRDLKTILVSEKLEQIKEYKRTLSEIVTNSALAIVLYHSFATAISRVKKLFGYKVKKSTELFSDYKMYFAYALINEVTETFRNRYETLLYSALLNVDKNNKHKGGGFMHIEYNYNNKDGVQIVNSKVEESIIKPIIGRVSPSTIEITDKDKQDLEYFADKLRSVECADLPMSKKLELAGLVHEIIENAQMNNGRTDNELFERFKAVIDTISKVAKEVVVKIAAGAIATVVLKALGL